MMRVFLYARVSKAEEQKTDNQLLELRAWAQRAKHKVAGEFVDEISSRDTRPAKEDCKRRLRLKEAEGVAFVALDRWGRTMSELVLEIEEFIESKIAMVSLKEGLDFSSAAGRLQVNILASFANFERDRIRERTLSGLKRARAQGKIGGRHPKGCGCGFLSLDGKITHNGPIKPLRDEHNQIVGWEKQTPPATPQQITEGRKKIEHTPVCKEGGNTQKV